MKIVCDNCSTKYSIADEKVRGKVFKIKCKKCSHIIVVKGESTTGEGQPAGFDQKETRVFDYSGFEGQRGADAGGAAAADPIWHLVIDREQVGPLTVAELTSKWDAGEIDRETYAWREGFADWQRLSAIEELAAVTSRGAAASASTSAPPVERRPAITDETDAGGLFGGATSTPSATSHGATRADPTDLFAGAGTSTEDEAPSDLFGGSAAAAPAAPVYASSVAASGPNRRSAREELFGTSEGAGADVGAEPLAAAPRSEVRSMTAQRNENSVLFSLNNLSALAASEPATPTTRSSGLGSSFGGSGAEGSGLIDIRAMAAMTMGATKKEDQQSGGPRTRSHSEDDLPVFSATSFSAPAAGVLMPTVQPQNNRLVYIFMGVVGLLAIAAIVLVAVIFLGKKSPITTETPGIAASASDPVAPSNPPSATATPAAIPTTPPAATPPSGTPPSGTSPTPAVTPPAATPTKEPAKDPKDEKPTAAATPTPPAPTPRKPTPPRPDRTTEKPAPVAATEPKPAATPPAPAADPTPKPAQKCDEVACLVTPDLPCCPKKGGAPRPAPAADSSLPDKLEQGDIIAGMKNVNGRVMACNDRFRVPGAFKVKVTVNGSGDVSAVSTTPPIAGTGAAGCVESAVRGAHFKKTKQSITFLYPYTFR